jgi:pimeloyl-ACP methyl ester carboxylesterase
MRYYREDFLRSRDGAQLFWSLHGEGSPPLVMSDGLGCDGFAWKYLLRHLTPTHRVLRWHYRGHGRSALPEAEVEIGIETFADDLDEVMDAAGIPKAVILGHSMGVQVNFEFHKRHPGRALALVPICGSYGNPLDTVHDDNTLKRVFPYLRRLVDAFPDLSRRVAQAVLPTEAALQYALWLEVNRRLVRREDFAPYFAHLARMDPRVFLRTLESAAQHSAWEHLPSIDVPTLVIAADHDRFTPLWLSERMHRAIRRSELQVVQSASHTAVIEMPELIALRIERFLKERVRAPAQAA